MSKLAWYWHRLRAMDAGEITGRVRKKFLEFADARRERDWAAVALECSGAFPKLPGRGDAPAVLRAALKRDVEDILAGRWKAFGHLELRVDDPPKWHCDYLVGRDLATMASAFKLNHRDLSGGADIKLIWELSRWNQLVRLAQAAYVLEDERAAQKCVRWLEDWVMRNPPYRGWNWTSALESGLRLIQFTWIDALLAERAEKWGFDAELETLRQEILPAHAWFTWRHQSFGSSANNHLIGELAGLIVATARWPALAQWGASLDVLQAQWEGEVLAQFHEDGGNKEQALNYQWFSWELCWQAQAALRAAGRTTAPAVEERLRRAAAFFVDVQMDDAWDYGDSDSAFVSPMFLNEARVAQEWRRWLRSPAEEPALDYWWGAARRDFKFEIPNRKESAGWRFFPESGQAVNRSDAWTLRWDLSPLGLGRTAAHGHLDALHLSLWFKGTALVIDPGTGCYYADRTLRAWLASRPAHNGPCPETDDGPQRHGPFLWAEPHGAPLVNGGRAQSLETGWKAELTLKTVTLGRRIESSDAGRSLVVEDWVEDLREDWRDAPRGFCVRWQFAPGTKLEPLAARRFRVTRNEVTIEVQVNEDWADVFPVSEPSQTTQADPGNELAGTVSPAFRQTAWAPYLKLFAQPGKKPCVFRTTFLASFSL